MFLKIENVSIPHGLEVTVLEKKLKIKNSKVGFSVELHSAFDVKIGKKGFLFLSFCYKTASTLRYNRCKIQTLYPLLVTLKRKIMQVFFGLSTGFTKQLDLMGVGYRVEGSKNSLLLKLGFSHEIILVIPAGIKVFFVKETLLILQSCSKDVLGSFVSEVQKCKIPDAYKNKGVLCREKFLHKKKVKKK
jgi:ribosomal protein L6P/L9E